MVLGVAWRNKIIEELDFEIQTCGYDGAEEVRGRGSDLVSQQTSNTITTFDCK